AAAFEHVEKIGIAADIELAGPFQAHATIAEQTGQYAVDDGGADLTLDVVADDGQAMLLEAAPPCRLAGDEDGDTVHHPAAGGEGLLHVPARGLFAAHG